MTELRSKLLKEVASAEWDDGRLGTTGGLSLSAGLVNLKIKTSKPYLSPFILKIWGTEICFAQASQLTFMPSDPPWHYCPMALGGLAGAVLAAPAPLGTEESLSPWDSAASVQGHERRTLQACVTPSL